MAKTGPPIVKALFSKLPPGLETRLKLSGWRSVKPWGVRLFREGGIRHGASAFLTTFDFAVKFSPENRNFTGRTDADADSVSLNSGDHDLDIVAHHDRFAHFS